MTDSTTQCPSEMSDAEACFVAFLLRCGWPGRIVWVNEASARMIGGTVLVSERRQPSTVQTLYGQGVRQGLGVQLVGVWKHGNVSLCDIAVPVDARDAELRLMSRGLKLSVRMHPRHARLVGFPGRIIGQLFGRPSGWE